MGIHNSIFFFKKDNGFITATFKKDNEMLDYQVTSAEYLGSNLDIKNIKLSFQTGLLIGADGIHSLVREFVLNRKVIPRDNEKTIWRLVVPKSEIHTEVFRHSILCLVCCHYLKVL